MMGWQWHQLDHLQVICTSLQTDNHASTSSFFTGQMLFLMSSQQCKSAEGSMLATCALCHWQMLSVCAQFMSDQTGEQGHCGLTDYHHSPGSAGFDVCFRGKVYCMFYVA